MAIENVQRARLSLVSSVYYRAHIGWARKDFQNNCSQMPGKRNLNLVFANNRAILLIVKVEFRECARLSFVSISLP